MKKIVNIRRFLTIVFTFDAMSFRSIASHFRSNVENGPARSTCV
ncbi:hypothetical protein [Mycolicibacterium llatzerense]|nr:hypothetical protein [Mycolicibacterium llatzerense]